MRMFKAINARSYDVGKYFSRNLVLKTVHVTCSPRVCINCYIPCHQYSTSATRRNVTNNSLCSSVHPNTLQIFSHSRIQASASSGVALPENLAGWCFMKSSIATGRVGATTALGGAAMGCIASTIRWIA